MQFSKYPEVLGAHIPGTSPLMEATGFIRHVDSDGLDDSDDEEVDDDITRNNISLDKEYMLRTPPSTTPLKTFAPEPVSANTMAGYSPESHYLSSPGYQTESSLDNQHSVKKRMSVASRLRMFGRKKSTVGLV